MEQILQQSDQSMIKECEQFLSHLQMQSSCLNSLDKALETVTDLSIALACNLQLARCDSILKVCAPHLHEHDFNRLRRTRFKVGDLFCPTTLDHIQKSMKDLLKDRKLIIDNLSSQIGVERTGVPLLHRTHSSFRGLLQVVEETGGSDNQRGISHGGRLQFFWKVWEDLYCHPRVVQILKQGYQTTLQSNPPMSVYPMIQSSYNRPEKHGYLKQCTS